MRTGQAIRFKNGDFVQGGRVVGKILRTSRGDFIPVSVPRTPGTLYVNVNRVVES